MLAELQDIHFNLRPQGEWYESNNHPSAQEMPRAEAYLGLFGAW